MSFTTANAKELGALGGHNGKGKPKHSPRTDIGKLQRVALNDATNQETNVAVKASLMRAYVDLQELRMALEGIGRPKPVEARNASPRKRPRAHGPIGDAAPRVREPSPPAATPGQVAGEQTNVASNATSSAPVSPPADPGQQSS